MRVRAFALGVWDFVVGDDWRTAVGVGLSLALTALVAQAGIAAWWVLPASALLVLWLSIRRAARDAALSAERHGQELLGQPEE
jgi:hypothetical protein